MTTTMKKRLDEALEIGHKIDNELKLEKSEKIINNKIHNNSMKISKLNEVNVGDENGIYCIAVHPERHQAAIGLGSGLLHVYDSEKWTRTRKLRSDMIISLPLLAVKFYPCRTRNVLFTGGSNGLVKVWNLESFNVVQSIEEVGNQITSLDFSSDGTTFATVGKDHSVRVYDSNRLATSRVYTGSDALDIDSIEDELSIPGHSQKIFAVKYHPDDKNVLISASWDHTLKIWDMRLDNAVRTIHGPFVCGDGLDICHNSVLTASWKASDALQIWDYRMESEARCLTFPTDNRKGQFLYCGRFWDDNHVVAGGSGTNDLKIVNVNANKVVGSISGNSRPVQAVEVKARNNMILCGTTGNLLRHATIAH